MKFYKHQLSTSHSFYLFIFIFSSLCLIIAPYFGNIGTFHDETMGFFVHYTRPDWGFFRKIFNPNYTENGMYQARELSYVFDFFDAHFTSFLLKNNLFKFFPLSHFLTVIGSVICLMSIFLSPQMRHHKLTLSLLTLLWLTNTNIFWSSNLYFRSAKIISSFFLIFFFTILFHLFHKIFKNLKYEFNASIFYSAVLIQVVFFIYDFTNKLANKTIFGHTKLIIISFAFFLGIFILKKRKTQYLWTSLGIFFLLLCTGLLLSLSDRQGYFFTLVFTIIFSVLGVFYQEKRTELKPFFQLTASSLIWSNIFINFYNQKLIDFFVFKSSGYTVMRTYQPLSNELVDSFLTITHWSEGISVLFSEIRFLLFSPSLVMGLLVLLIIFVTSGRGLFQIIQGRNAVLVPILLMSLLITPIVLYVAMCTRGHLMGDSFLRTYYYIPTTTFLFLIVGFVLIFIKNKSHIKIIEFTFCVCIIVNLYSLPEHLRNAGFLSLPGSNSNTNSIVKILTENDLSKVPPLTPEVQKTGFLLSDPKGYFLRAWLKNEWPKCHIFKCDEPATEIKQ